MAAPTPDGFLDFIRNVVGIGTDVLPDTSPFLVLAYGAAKELCPSALNVSPSIYTLAVYYLGASILLNSAQDVSGQTYFRDIRKEFGLDSIPIGPLTSASDEGTSGSVQLPDFYKSLTLADLQYMKDPYGRQYLMYVQNLGNTWGLTP